MSATDLATLAAAAGTDPEALEPFAGLLAAVREAARMGVTEAQAGDDALLTLEDIFSTPERRDL